MNLLFSQVKKATFIDNCPLSIVNCVKMKIFQNKFFLICLCIAVVLAAVPSVFAVMGYTSLSKNIVGTVVYPFRWCVNRIGDGIEGWSRYFQSIDALEEENARLEAERDALLLQQEEAELLRAENERLRNYLSVKASHPTLILEEALVVGYSAGNYMTSFTLNRGSLHGVTVGMPVITADGIVGSISDVGLNWCTVLTLSDPTTAAGIGAYIPRSGEVGIVSGEYALWEEGLCRLGYLNSGADVEEGDLVLSSGTGNVYPEGLVIGRVESVSAVSENSPKPTATVRLSVNTDDLRWVMIVVAEEPAAE